MKGYVHGMDCIQEGIEIGRINQLVELVKAGLLAISDAAAVANMQENDFAKLINKEI